MNPLAMKSGDIFPNPPLKLPQLAIATIPNDVLTWLERFEKEQWSGSITFHFSRGMLSSYEPKPNLKTVAK